VSAIYDIFNAGVIRGVNKNTIKLIIVIAEKKLKYFNNNISFFLYRGDRV
jgi:hypothetical protein